MANEIEKAWWESKTVWGGVIALLGGLAAGFGYVVSPEDQEIISGGIVGIASAVGGLLAVYGRVKATKAIK